MQTILITGGTGLIGRQLTSMLTDRGDTVIWLTRKINENEKVKQYQWNWKKKEINLEAIEKANVIINLTGASINGKRWSEQWKKEIYNSRIQSTDFLCEVLAKENHHVKTFISASAVGYYGAVTSDKIYSETDLPSNDFLGNTCSDWEKSANKISQLNIRTIIIRTGIVLSKNSEAFQKICLPVRWGFGAAIGNGRQYFPWIHMDDLCGIYLKAIANETVQGAYNAVAPSHLTNYELIKMLSKKLHRHFFLPNIPGFIIQIIFGEFADSLLHGSRISSEKIIHAGYKFKYENFEMALEDLLDK